MNTQSIPQQSSGVPDRARQSRIGEPGHLPQEGGGGASSFGRKQSAWLLRYGTLLACVLVLLYFAVEKSDTYPTWANFKGLLTLSAPLMLMAIVLTVPLRVGDFDLSVGYQAQFAGAVTVVLMAKHGFSTPLGIVVTLAAGVIVGTFLGCIVAYSGVSAFVITLAAGSVLFGLEIQVTNNSQVSNNIPKAFTDIASGHWIGIPLPILIEIVAVALLWLIQDKTIFGRQVSAVGSSSDAARLSGVRVELVRAGAFSIVGVGCAIAGMLLASQAQSYYPSAATGLLLPAYAACFLGSTILRPGTFHVLGSVIGVIFLGALQNGIVQLNYSPAVANIIQGVVLALAVLTSQLGRRMAR
jgi:ribose transport system permease protein